MDYICEYDSLVGVLTICSDGENITGLWIKGQKYFAATLDRESIKKGLPIFDTKIKLLTMEGADTSKLYIAK